MRARLHLPSPSLGLVAAATLAVWAAPLAAQAPLPLLRAIAHLLTESNEVRLKRLTGQSADFYYNAS